MTSSRSFFISTFTTTFILLKFMIYLEKINVGKVIKMFLVSYMNTNLNNTNKFIIEKNIDIDHIMKKLFN